MNARTRRNPSHVAAAGRAPLVTLLAIVDLVCVGVAIARIFG